MVKIGFVGAYEKTDFIVQIAKLLVSVGKKVIVIDSTINQKTKYIIPVIKPTKTYITEFEEFDVAVGFENFEQMNEYLGEEGLESNYDYELIDIDTTESFEGFLMENAKINSFVTSFDLYSLKRGLEILSGLKNEQKLKKILFSNDINVGEDEYLNFLSVNYKIIWDDDKIYFPQQQEDRNAIIENQRESKVKFKNLSQGYRECLIYIANEILGDNSTNILRRNMKNIDKGV